MTKPHLNQMTDKIEFPQIKNMKKNEKWKRLFLYFQTLKATLGSL
jgi:hypothetical protein